MFVDSPYYQIVCFIIVRCATYIYVLSCKMGPVSFVNDKLSKILVNC